MCMGCMNNADFLISGGMVGAASLRVGVRRFLPVAPRWTRRVSDAEADEFVASLAQTALAPTADVPVGAPASAPPA